MPKRSSISKSLLKYALLVPGLYGFFINMLVLVKMEARLASRSVIFILILSFMVAILISAAWLYVLGCAYYLLLTLQLSWSGAALCIFGVNAALVIFLLYFIMHTKKKVFFPHTLRQLRKLRP